MWLGALGLATTLITWAPLTADAAAVSYQISSVSVAVNNSSSGLKLFADTSVLHTSVFTLDDGDSVELAAFRVGTNESSVDLDDLLPKMVKATFSFSGPATVDAEVKGVSFGVDLLFGKEFGVIAFGPPDVVTSSLSTFSVGVQSAAFPVPGSAVVKVKVKQLASRPVPEPASITLLVSGGVLVVGTLRRRRRSATA